MPLASRVPFLVVLPKLAGLPVKQGVLNRKP
jgi:hypothetical protein